MRSAVLFALICMSPACDFFDDDSGDPGSYVAYEDIETAYKDAYCTHAANCGLFPDKTACLTADIDDLTLRSDVLAGIQAGKIFYDGNAVKKCLDALAAVTCDTTDEDSRGLPPVCNQFTHGLGMQGDECFADAECISGTCSGETDAPTCQPGTCIGNTAPTYEPAALGESCSSFAGCVSGAYCDNLTFTCAPLKMQGTACEFIDECAYGLACVYDTTGSSTCAALPGPNERCTSGVPCRDEGFYCDLNSATPTCKPLGLASATCTTDTQCSRFYPCDSTGHCAKLPGVGQSCIDTFKCFDEGTFCDTNTYTCTALLSDGAMCTSDTQCVSQNCDLDVAVPICATPPTCL